MRFASILAALLLLATSGMGRAESAAGAPAPAPAVALLVEPLSEEWRERLLGPLLARLLPLGPRDVEEAAPSDALARVTGEPGALALMRRSHISGAAGTLPIEYLELGPAACVALVTRGELPFGSYAELNYTDAGGPLRIVHASDNARSLFDRVQDQFPLSGAVTHEQRPAIIGLQRLSAGEADLLVLDVPRLSRSGVPAEKVVAALARGHRLLTLPAALPAPGMGLMPGEVQLDDPPFWRGAATYRTFCDPFILVVRRDMADRLVHRLYAPVAPDPAEQGFVDQMLSAARGLGTIIAAGLPL